MFPNVAVYLDDQSAQLPGRNLDVYAADLERIEVLEGPQGTLFGGGAESGILRYVTNKPKLDVLEASVNAGYSVTAHGDPGTAVDAVVNFLSFRADWRSGSSSTMTSGAGTSPTPGGVRACQHRSKHCLRLCPAESYTDGCCSGSIVFP
ncbi:MAG: hypothetical protein QM777_06600, partial [Pseudorhodoferax sp.]